VLRAAKNQPAEGRHLTRSTQSQGNLFVAEYTEKTPINSAMPNRASLGQPSWATSFCFFHSLGSFALFLALLCVPLKGTRRAGIEKKVLK
jgi:hypothetical protein